MQCLNKIEVFFFFCSQNCVSSRLACRLVPLHVVIRGPRFRLSCFSTIPYGSLCLPDPSWVEGTCMFWVSGRINSVEGAQLFLKSPAHHGPTSLLLSLQEQELSHIAVLTAREAGKDIYTYDQPYVPQFNYYRRRKE